MKNLKILSALTSSKLLWLVYFAGGTFVYMVYDLFLGKTGALSTTAMWQLMITTMLLTVTQVMFYGVDGERTSKKRVALHIIVNYIVMLTLCIMFSWLPPLSLKVVLGFSLAFALIYAGIFTGFTIFFVLNNERFNDKLKLWRAKNT